MTLFSCSDASLRSRKNANREQYPPSKMFKGDALSAAQKMYDGDIAEMEREIKQNNLNLNKLDDSTGYTLLMYATIIEDMRAMEKLLSLGADPTIIIPDGGLANPLNHAVALNNYKMMDLLFKYKANPNPKIGRSPLINAMLVGGFKNTEKKLIDYLLAHGADINNISLNGDNIMEAVTRDDLDMALYFLEKGGQPVIEGTTLCPVAKYIQFEEQNQKKFKNEETPYFKKLMTFKQKLIEKYNVKFPYEKDTMEEARLRIKLYEHLSPQDKISINFKKNYGEKWYQKDLELVEGK
ncbi:ankyrin repeat domain-containing protein [Chryseobacterium oryctis]|nr:ankyrin repeat domain-containing protein [Chryseobacterium oryctis]